MQLSNEYKLKTNYFTKNIFSINFIDFFHVRNFFK